MPNDTAWIRTFSGGRFYVLEPRAEDVRIEDIAHALSMQCRFTGHSNRFYSVAEHSVWVSRRCDPADALWGLLHDASEAYIGDMSAPLKHQPEMSRFRTTEKRIMAAVAEKFGLAAKEPDSVRTADRRMLLTEARDLGLDVGDWYAGYAPFPSPVFCLIPQSAEALFLERFRELTSSAVPQADGCWIDEEADVHSEQRAG